MKAMSDFDERMKERRESNSEIQRRAKMTKHEKSVEAIDYFTKEIKSNAERGGREMTETQARSEAVKIAERSERKIGK